MPVLPEALVDRMSRRMTLSQFLAEVHATDEEARELEAYFYFMRLRRLWSSPAQGAEQ